MGSHIVYNSCPCIEYWPEDRSLELKNVTNYVLMTIYMLCLDKLLYLFVKHNGMAPIKIKKQVNLAACKITVKYTVTKECHKTESL